MGLGQKGFLPARGPHCDGITYRFTGDASGRFCKQIRYGYDANRRTLNLGAEFL
jgi:hypothetical protein